MALNNFSLDLVRACRRFLFCGAKTLFVPLTVSSLLSAFAIGDESSKGMTSTVTYDPTYPVVVESLRPTKDFPDPDRRDVREEGELVLWIMSEIKDELESENMGFENKKYFERARERVVRIKEILDTGRLLVQIRHRKTAAEEPVAFIGYSAEDSTGFNSLNPLHFALQVLSKELELQGPVPASVDGRVNLNLTPKAIQIIALYKELKTDLNSRLWDAIEGAAGRITKERGAPAFSKQDLLNSFQAWFKGFIYHEMDHVRQGLDVQTRRASDVFRDEEKKKDLLEKGFLTDLRLLAELVFGVEVKEGDPFQMNRDLLMAHADALEVFAKALGKVMKSGSFSNLFTRKSKFGLLLVKNDLPEYYLKGDAVDAKEVNEAGNLDLAEMTVDSNFKLLEAFVSGREYSFASGNRRVEIEDFKRGYFTGPLELFMRGQYVPFLVVARLKYLQDQVIRKEKTKSEVRAEVAKLSARIKDIKNHPRFKTFIGFYPEMKDILTRAKNLAQDFDASSCWWAFL